MKALGIDVGGSGIKGALVDLKSGELFTERLRIKTPGGFEPEEKTYSTLKDCSSTGTQLASSTVTRMTKLPPRPMPAR